VVETSLSSPSRTDDIADAVDYAAINTIVREVFTHEHKLLETTARAIAEAINTKCKGAKEVRVSIKKMKPLGLGAVGYSIVEFVLPEDL
ncbi:MAG: dihydroneopterin aldolase, partial [Bacteroidetes bacterium]|nr:dihydroneopterin aldolase [Bacteroidota bacterium]